MKQIAVNVNDPPSSILLGRQGEHLATRVVFDCTDFAALYGEGSAELLHRREEEIYPVQTRRDGARVIWDITASDTASAGTGHAELRWMVGETVAKSAMFRTSVSAALSDEEPATPPLPYQSWVDAVLNAAQEIRDSAVTEEQLTAAIEAYLAENPIDTGLDESALAAYLTENGYLTDAALAQALADAADSGAFDGADGAPGADGADGGYYTPSVTQPTDSTMQVAFSPSQADMPAVEPVTVALPASDSAAGETIETIADVTTTEEVTEINITTDTDGNPFALRYAHILVEVVCTDTNTAEAALRIRTNANSAALGGTNTSATRVFRPLSTSVESTKTPIVLLCDTSIVGFINNIGNTGANSIGYTNLAYDALTALYLSGGTFGVGSRVVIKGIRK